MTRVSIDAGLLQLIVNGLKRDANDGRVVRGEWVQEIEKDARPIPAEQVNERLLEALTLPHLYEGQCPDDLQPSARDPHCPACKAIAAAEAQQAGPARLSDEDFRSILESAYRTQYGDGPYSELRAAEEAALRANGLLPPEDVGAAAGGAQPEPELVEGAPCRNTLRRDGKPFPKSSCQRCGTLIRPGWKCADGVEV